MWYLWIPNSTLPLEFDDYFVLLSYLNTLHPNTTVVVKEYRMVELSTKVYNLPGGDPFPPNPPKPPKFVVQQRQRIVKE